MPVVSRSDALPMSHKELDHQLDHTLVRSCIPYITMGIEQRVDKGGCFKNCMLKSYSLLMAAQKYLFEMQNEYVS